jgi:hypothetical protein
MRKTPALAAILLLVSACASAPSTERVYVPGRPEVPRPEGIESEGLTAVRDSIDEQRSTARDLENALNLTPTQLNALGGPAWYETALSPFTSFLGFFGLW